jgi:hypothetical protein
MIKGEIDELEKRLTSIRQEINLCVTVDLRYVSFIQRLVIKSRGLFIWAAYRVVVAEVSMSVSKDTHNKVTEGDGRSQET